jgi:GWxTD domain-containing protein
MISSACLFLTALAWTTGVRAQTELPEFIHQFEAGVPRFNCDVVVKAGADSAVLTAFTRVAYDQFGFTRDSSGYRAGFELVVTVLDTLGHSVDSRQMKKELTTDTFDKTRSRSEIERIGIPFSVPWGRYDVVWALTNLESQKTGYLKARVSVPDYSTAPLAFVLWPLDSLGQPCLPCNFTRNAPLRFGYQIASRLHVDSLRVEGRVLDARGKVLFHEDRHIPLSGRVTEGLWTFTAPELQAGSYRFHITAAVGEAKAEAARVFSFNWSGMPALATNVDEAIEQLRYIAKKDEIKKIKNAPAEDRERLFLEFWRERDPTPQTEENELMEEYYRRVVFSASFADMLPGWKTDRGMVYILLGPPDEIDRHPFESDTKPYEVWIYNSRQREYVFQDYSGFGDYKLVSFDWDDLNLLH